MKRITCIILSAVMAAAVLSGCGSKETKDASSVSSLGEAGEADNSETDETSLASENEDSSYSLYEYIDGDWTFEDCMTIGEYKGLELTKEVHTVTDEDVAGFYESIMEPETVEDPDAEVVDGDVINSTYQFKIGDEDYNEAQEYSFQVGADSNIDGFEEGMIGHKAGDDVYLDLQFPDDYWDTSLAGFPATFHVVINEIQRTPQPTDEWVEENTNGDYKTVSEFDEYIREYLEATMKATSQSNLRNSAWSQIYGATEFKKLPKELVDKGSSIAMDEVLSQMAMYGLETLDEYLEMSDITQEDFDAYLVFYGEVYAEKRLIVDYIWEKEGLSEESSVYKNVLKEIADANGMTENEVIEMYGEDVTKEYCRTIAVNDTIVNYGKITEEEVEEVY